MEAQATMARTFYSPNLLVVHKKSFAVRTAGDRKNFFVDRITIQKRRGAAREKADILRSSFAGAEVFHR